MRVTWDEPEFLDNSGKPPRINVNSPNGGRFTEGQHQVLIFYLRFVFN
jgi:hypothetical protein